jgi:hypothetical protein
VLVDVAEGIDSVSHFFLIVQELYNICGASSKRVDKVADLHRETIVELIEEGLLATGKGKNQDYSLQKLSTTRWNCRYKSMTSLINLFSSLLNLLRELSGADSNLSKKQKAAVRRLLNDVTCFNFSIHLHMMTALLMPTNRLSHILQQKDIDIVDAMTQVDNLKIIIKNMRDEEFLEIWNDSVAFSEEHKFKKEEIPAKVDESRRGARDRGAGRGGVGSDSCRSALFIENESVFRDTCNVMLLELDTRFSSEVMALLKLVGAFNPRDSFAKFKIKNIMQLASVYYKADFNATDLDLLRNELKSFEALIKEQTDDTTFRELKNLQEFCVALTKNGTYPYFNRLIRLILILPVSTATTERSFSMMKIIKTRLRTKLGDQYMSDLMVILIEKEIVSSITLHQILEMWITISEIPRRLLF